MTRSTLPVPNHDATSRPADRMPPHRLAAFTAIAVAAVYGLLATGVLDLGDAESGELGILGAAGVVHLLLAGLLWVWPRRLLLVSTVLVQLALGAMYVAIAPNRDPSYEVWGLTIRVLSVALAVLAIVALVDNARSRPPAAGPRTPA